MTKTRKHIVFVSQSFYPSPGGVSTLVYNLADALIKNGYHVTCIHLGDPSNLEVPLDLNNIIIPLNKFSSEELQKYSEFKEALYRNFHNLNRVDLSVEEIDGYDTFIKINDEFKSAILKVHNERKIDILHVHDYQVIEAVQGLGIDSKKIISLHFPVHENISEYVMKYLKEKLAGFDTVVVSTPEYKDILMAKQKINNIVVCEPLSGEMYSTFRQQPNVRDKKNILCVQRFDHKSGHGEILNAFSLLDDKPYSLRFIGGGSLTNKISNVRNDSFLEIKEVVKNKGLTDKVEFVGNVDYGNLKKYYADADLFVVLSKMECFCLALTEAMSQGLPIIASNVGGLKYQVIDGYNGFLVDSDKPDIVAQKIDQILSDEELYKKFSRNGRKRYESDFAYNLILAKSLKLYE